MVECFCLQGKFNLPKRRTMSESFSDLFLSLINTDLLSRIRRNHGLEHATLHVLAERMPSRSVAGHSNVTGFWILGDVTTAELSSAVQEALGRLQNGEHSLAIHPNCGTNFATSGVMAGLAASLAMFGAGRRFRDKLERVPLAVTLATLALIVAQPMGLKFQQNVTTSGYPDGLKVLEVRQANRGKVTAHRVITSG
jgi:hypothetical protein